MSDLTLHSVTVGQPLGLGLGYGFANFIVFMAYAVTFRFAAFLLTLPVDHILYVGFEEIFTVFVALILGSLMAGQASAALPQASRAVAAARRLLAVMATQAGDEVVGEKEETPVSAMAALDLCHLPSVHYNDHLTEAHWLIFLSPRGKLKKHIFPWLVVSNLWDMAEAVYMYTHTHTHLSCIPHK